MKNRAMWWCVPPLLLAAANLPAADPLRPNILFIYADDWGFGDLHCHGLEAIQTPNLDKLAREGTDFHQFTVCNPVCSPSRTAILTGRYPARFLVHQHFASHEQNVARGMPDWLDPKVTLLPRLLHEAGYATGHFGKWHLSGGDLPGAPLPADYGYDDAAVWTGPGKSVFDDSSYEAKRGRADDEVAASFQSAAAVEHATRFIRSVKGRPFYVNLWLHETHHLVSATAEDRKAYPHTPEPQRTYYSAVTRADRLIGRMLDLLVELGVDQNTLVIFSSDNGPEHSQPKPGDKLYHSVGVTGGLRGQKRSLYLGGVNVPFIVRWPGQVPAGRIDKTSVLSGVDMLPTILTAAKIPLPAGYQGDGVNVLAAFRGESFVRDRPLFWEWRGTHARDVDWPGFAMRDGDWGLITDEQQQRIELYDLVKDRFQKTNLADRNPDRVAWMLAAIRQWKSTLPVSEYRPELAPKRGPVKKAAAPIPAVDRAKAFERWDENKDNLLTLEEYRAGLSNKANADSRFKGFDKNNDGRLTRAEFVGPAAP